MNEKDSEIIRLYKSGKSIGEIHRHLKIPFAYVSFLVEHRGIKLPPSTYGKGIKRDWDGIIAAYNDGWKFKDICERFNISRFGIERVLSKMMVPRRSQAVNERPPSKRNRAILASIKKIGNKRTAEAFGLSLHRIVVIKARWKGWQEPEPTEQA